MRVCSTSPYVFSQWNKDSAFVLSELTANPYIMFIRKVTSEFIPMNII
jgi:hypothetical protein